MKHRTYWIEKVEQAWSSKSVVWLSGVRRVGKTVLCQSLDDVEYFDCALPRVRRLLADPEAFLEGLRGKRIVLDEVQRLDAPSEALKIAADHYPDVRIVATGSSTLQASTRFRDTLTGRKAELWLTPMMSVDLVDFADAGGEPSVVGGGAPQADLRHRLRHGGLPPFFLRRDPLQREYEEWMDSYWARDIQELFRLERRWGFRRFLELLLAQSGGMFEAAKFAAPCEISRTTVANYLEVLEATRVVHVLRPFSTHPATEIVSAPKVYGFDTGFVCHQRGWTDLRPENLGDLWEHYILNEIHAHTQSPRLHYWRDKRGHEVDFVLAWPGLASVAIECKWSANGFDPQNLRSFRYRYPEGENWIVAADVTRPFRSTEDGLPLEFLGLETLAARISDL